MPRASAITGVQLGFPLIEQLQGSIAVTDFIAQVVGDPAIRINIKKILPQLLRKKPARNRKVFVVRAGQTTAVLLCLTQARSFLGNGILSRKTRPSLQA